MPYVRTYRMSSAPRGSQRHPIVRSGGGHTISELATANPSNTLHGFVQAVRRGMGQDETVDLPGGGFTDLTTGLTYDASGNPVLSGVNVSVPPLTPLSNPPVPTSSGGLPPGTVITGTQSTPTNWAGILAALTGGAVSGTKIYQTLQGPGLIAGTQAIYNPTTGQFYNPTTGQVVNPTGSSTVNLASGLAASPLLLYGGLALGAVLLISMMGKH